MRFLLLQHTHDETNISLSVANIRNIFLLNGIDKESTSETFLEVDYEHIRNTKDVAIIQNSFYKNK